MKKKAHFSTLILILATLSLPLAFSSSISDTQFFIELPDAFLETVEKNPDGSLAFWHPRVRLYKQERALQERKSEPKPNNNGFLSFMQVGQGSEPSVVLFPNQEGFSMLKSSKMNCQCRFVKDPTANLPTAFLELPNSKSQNQEIIIRDDEPKHGGVSLIEKPHHQQKEEENSDDLKSMLLQLQNKLDEEENEREQKEKLKAALLEKETKHEEDNLQLQLLQLLKNQNSASESEELSYESSSSDSIDMETMLIQMMASESESEYVSESESGPEMDMEDFAKFVEMYQTYQEFNGKLKEQTKNAKNSKKAHKHKKQLVEISNDQEYDEEEKLLQIVQKLQKKGFSKAEIIEALAG